MAVCMNRSSGCLCIENRQMAVPSPVMQESLASLALAAGNGPEDDQGLLSGRDLVGQWSVRRFVGKVLLTSEEPQERPALLRDVVTDRTAQHRIAGLERVKHRAQRGLTLEIERHLAPDMRQSSQMLREYDTNHIRLIKQEALCLSASA